MDITFIPSSTELMAEVRKVCDWADRIRFAYAWMHSDRGRAMHWEALPLAKIEQGIVGVQGYGTDPHVLRQFRDECPGRVRVAESNRSALFHPKLLLGEREAETRVVMGSSNYTASGHGRNTESNVLVNCSAEDEFTHRVQAFIDEQWDRARRKLLRNQATEGWLEDYERRYRSHRSRPLEIALADLAPTDVVGLSAEVLQMSLPEYVSLILDQDGRELSRAAAKDLKGQSDETVYYLQLFPSEEEEGFIGFLREVSKVWEHASSLEDMSRDERQRIGGTRREKYGYFGSMQGHGVFANYTLEQPVIFDKALRLIPLSGEVPANTLREYLEYFEDIERMGIASSTRFLAMKRPDLFFSANEAMQRQANKVFGFKPKDPDSYLEAISILGKAPWYTSGEPERENQKEVWRYRTALLDTCFYEPRTKQQKGQDERPTA